MEEEDDNDEWRPQQFYLDVINGACEPIGGGHIRVRHIVPDPSDDNLCLVIFSDLLSVERERERERFSKFCEYQFP
jgi:hypothetical protein